MPLHQASDRVRRDVTVTDNTQSETTIITSTTAASDGGKIPNNDNSQNNSPDGGVTEAKGEYPGQLTDDFLKKQVFLNKTTAEKDVKTHNEYKFDNVSL